MKGGKTMWSGKKSKKENIQDPLKDIKEYFSPQKTIVAGIIIAPIVFLLMFWVSAKKGPSKKYAPSTIQERIFWACLFAGLVILLSIVIPWIRYYKILSFIKKTWPSDDEQEILNNEFLHTTNVFRGYVRIGHKYTFLIDSYAWAPKIILTEDIKSFSSGKIYAGRNGVFIGVYVNTKNENLPILRFPTKEQELADNEIKEAEDILMHIRDQIAIN